MLGLRLDEPLRPATGSAEALDAAELERLEQHGLVVRGDGTLTLTRRGRFLGGGVTARLLALSARSTIGSVMDVPLSQRQQELLRRVVEEYVSTGQPVGSKTLVERGSLAVSSSTVRNDLAELERRGLMMHPHTSAGRVPTEAGYRLYVDELLMRPEARPDAIGLGLPAARAEVEEALQATTEVLSQVTRLLALVSAPPFESATVRHVEVLLLQANVVMVVVITSTGSVTKLRYAFPEPLDPGLVTWAGDYLNEQLVGAKIGSRTIRRVFADADALASASSRSCSRSATRSSIRPKRTGGCTSAARRACSRRCGSRRSVPTGA